MSRDHDAEAIARALTANHDANEPGTEVRVGTCLVLANGRSTIAVATASSTAFRRSWAPSTWTSAQRRRSYDVMLDRKAFVALEYALVERGLLAPAATAQA